MTTKRTGLVSWARIQKGEEERCLSGTTVELHMETTSDLSTQSTSPTTTTSSPAVFTPVTPTEIWTSQGAIMTRVTNSWWQHLLMVTGEAVGGPASQFSLSLQFVVRLGLMDQCRSPGLTLETSYGILDFLRSVEDLMLNSIENIRLYLHPICKHKPNLSCEGWCLHKVCPGGEGVHKLSMTDKQKHSIDFYCFALETWAEMITESLHFVSIEERR